ncbi:MAG: hypothetical protein LBO81_00180, partial [Clostridiales Family XIII bacterium]|nr:hypothetical protein [Clostridiales Family XIII bacterium]
VLADLGIESAIRTEDLRGLGEDERAAFAAVRKNGELTMDDLSRLLEKTAQQTAALVTALEIKGFVGYYGGKILIAK